VRVVAARIALDLLGGGCPDALAAGACSALDADPGLHVTVVGPADLASTLFGDAIGPERWSFVAAAGVVADELDALRAIRGRRDATARVAARLVRDGVADGFVSAGPASVTQAAASFGLGLLPGTTDASLAATLDRGTDQAPIVLVDAGANTDTDAGQLLQHAVQGSAYVRALAGTSSPRVVLLAATSDPDRLDLTRKRSFAVLASSAAQGLLSFAGATTTALLLGGVDAHLVVTDGFTGGVLRAACAAKGDAPADGASGVSVLLGFRGVACLSPATAPGVAHGLQLAATLHRRGLVDRTSGALGELIAHRRSAAGL
jgi:glycerol-3-phosphate acyltransferase PlsX